MGNRALAAVCHPKRSEDPMDTRKHQAPDRQLRTGCLLAMADRSGYPSSRLGANGAESTERLALLAQNLLCSARAEMGAARDRSAQAEGGEPVMSKVEE